MKRQTASAAVFSEENRERFYRATEFARKIVHYGWIPLIMLIGTKRGFQLFTNLKLCRLHPFRSSPFSFTLVESAFLTNLK